MLLATNRLIDVFPVLSGYVDNSVLGVTCWLVIGR